MEAYRAEALLVRLELVLVVAVTGLVLIPHRIGQLRPMPLKTAERRQY